MKTIFVSLTATVLLSACSTNQKSRLATTGWGIGAGAVIGSVTAPADERRELHAMYWGGIVGVATAIAANYYFSDERSNEVLRLENEKMKAQLEFFQNGPATLLKETKAGKSRVKLYKIDQWVEDGPNKRYHRDQMMEILPPEKPSK